MPKLSFIFMGDSLMNKNVKITTFSL